MSSKQSFQYMGLTATDGIGYAAGILVTSLMLPQIYLALKTKKTEDLSLLSLIILIMVAVLYTIYGHLINSYPLFIMDLIASFLDCYMLGLKLYYDAKNRKVSPSEVQEEV